MSKRRRHDWGFGAYGGGWAMYSCKRCGVSRFPSYLFNRLDRIWDNCTGEDLPI